MVSQYPVQLDPLAFSFHPTATPIVLGAAVRSIEVLGSQAEPRSFIGTVHR